MMDILYIEKLAVIVCIGVYDWEKITKQKLIFDIEIFCNNSKSAKSDNINDCINYVDVTEMIISYVQGKRFSLLERVAEEIAKLLLNNFNCSGIRIKISKPGALMHAKNVGIIIERRKVEK